MVLSGAPVPIEHAAQKTVDLALELLVTVRAAVSSFQAGADGRSLGLRIGIGTGAATLGQIGMERRLNYSAIGPAPNLAALPCDKAMDAENLISHATARQVDSEMKPAGHVDTDISFDDRLRLQARVDCKCGIRLKTHRRYCLDRCA